MHSAIAVTGAAGYIGRRLVERLLEDDRVERVVGVDVQPAPISHPKLTYLRQDINSPLESAFRDAGVEAVVHLAFLLRQARKTETGRRVNVDGTANVLRACEAAGVRKLVLLSSATVYGAHRDNPPFMTEETPPRPHPRFHYAVHKVQCETLCLRYADVHPDLTLTVLRGCIVMGPNARNFITAALDKPMLIGVRGADPEMQFLHEDDLLSVLEHTLEHDRPGTFNVAGSGTIRWSEVVALARKPMLWLPSPLAYALTEVAWQLRAQNDAPSAGLDFIRWPWTVSTRKLEQEMGVSMRYSSREAIESYLSIRRTPGTPIPQ